MNRRNVYKRAAVLILTAVLTLALTACNSSGDNGGGGGASSGATRVSLKVWGSQEDQALLKTMVASFKEEYPDTQYDITLGVVGEADLQKKFLEDPDAAADVFALPDDQLSDLVQAGALYEITRNTDTIRQQNSSGSVEAATVDGKLYAYPMTADNGYFLYYDKSVLTAEQVQSMETLLDVAASLNKKVVINLKEPWYTAGFFLGAGCTIEMDDQGRQSCDFNTATGVSVGESLRKIVNHAGFLQGDDSVFDANIGGTAIAGISGTWKAEVAMEKLGDNYAATKLPTFLVNGEPIQMGSFAGYKLIGVNRGTAYPVEAMKLAEWITNEQNQLLRFKEREAGPSNIAAAASENVQANQALAALAAQSEYAVPQGNVTNQFWLPARSFCETLLGGSTKSMQELLDAMVNQVGAA